MRVVIGRGFQNISLGGDTSKSDEAWEAQNRWREGQVAAIGMGVAAASEQPIATAMAGGTVLYSYQKIQ